MEKKLFLIISKVGLLVVIFGFFMPVSCGKSGFELAKSLRGLGSEGSTFYIASFLFILMFVSAVVGVGLLVLRGSQLQWDWVALLTGMGSGIVAYLMLQSKGAIVRSIMEGSMNIGSYLIIAGWGIGTVALVMASLPPPQRKEE